METGSPVIRADFLELFERRVRTINMYEEIWVEFCLGKNMGTRCHLCRGYYSFGSLVELELCIDGLLIHSMRVCTECERWSRPASLPM